MTPLELRGVSKSYSTTRVLDDVELDVPGGRLTAVLGPSGCGKTTLLRLIAGFAQLDEGTITVDGRLVAGPGRHVQARKRRVGYVAQEGALFPHLDVARNVTFGLPRGARADSARVARLLELVGLDPGFARRHPHELSGGQQQRVALARALAPEPAVVLLDEPFASLDTGLRESTGRAVAAALHAAHATAVLVTHDQAEALSLADQVAVMRDGRIVQAGPPLAVYRAPVDPGVAAFLGGAIVLAAVAGDGHAASALGPVVVEPDRRGPVDIVVRPEQIQIRPEAEGLGVAARVNEISFFGHDADVRLTLIETGHAVVARVHGAEAPAPGARVMLGVRGCVPSFAA
jgi:iron(III) transport system ATP-binding protein